MTDASDMDLVREFARSHSEAAFAELVRRHVSLVFSVARRCTTSDGDAEDVAQAVFALLARKAAGLRASTVVTGWLYETTRHTAATVRRTNVRRQFREQEAYMQSTLTDGNTAADWQRLAPQLEDAMSQLGEGDRTLLALRFYENKSGPEAAALLGIGEAAAHKRTARALEKLRKCFHRRGLALSATAIAGAISANAVQSAPAGLAAALTTAALSGTAIKVTALMAATKGIALTTLQKSVITVALAATLGAGIYEAREAAQARAEVRRLQQQQAPLAGQILALQKERNQATNLVARLSDELAGGKNHNLDLLRLRGEVGVLRRQIEEQTAGAGGQAQALAEKLSAQAEFVRDDDARTGRATMIAAALMNYVYGKSGQLPEDFTEVTNAYYGIYPKQLVKSDGLSDFEFFNWGTEVMNHDQRGATLIPELADRLLVFREKVARQAPDGNWYRIYNLGLHQKVVSVTTSDGNFDAWETANTYSPPANQ